MFFNNNTKRILLLGDSNAGKQSLALALSLFQEGKKPNLSAYKGMHFDSLNHCLKEGKKKINIEFIIHEFQEGKANPKRPTCDLIFIVIDLSQQGYLERLESYKNYSTLWYPGIKAIYIGSKADLVSEEEPKEDSLMRTSAINSVGLSEVESLLVSLFFPVEKKSTLFSWFS